MPNSVLRRGDLSVGAKLTFVALKSYAWQGHDCFPGQECVAGDLGISRRTVSRYLKELQEARLVLVERRGLGKTNRYILRVTPDVPKTTGLDVTDLPGKKTQREEDAVGRFDSNASISDDVLEGDGKAGAFGGVPAENMAGDERHGRSDMQAYRWLRAVVAEVTTQLGDGSSARSSTGRAFSLWRSSPLDLETFIGAVHQSKEATVRNRNRITLRSVRGDGTEQINGVPYFFAVLEGRLQVDRRQRADRAKLPPSPASPEHVEHAAGQPRHRLSDGPSDEPCEDVWSLILAELEHLGPVHRRLLARCRAVQTKDALVITAPDDHERRWLEARLPPPILNAMEQLGFSHMALSIQTSSQGT